MESESWVEIMLAANVSCANHVTDHLVDAFNDTIGLRVSRGNDFAFKTKVVLEGSSNFACEFSALVRANLCRPWAACEPSTLKNVGCAISTLVWDFNDLEPSGCRINHGHTVEFHMSVLDRIRVLLAERMSTNEIDTEGVPWNVLDILFDGNLPALEMALLKRFPDHTGPASAFDLEAWPKERVMLMQHQF